MDVLINTFRFGWNFFCGLPSKPATTLVSRDISEVCVCPPIFDLAAGLAMLSCWRLWRHRRSSLHRQLSLVKGENQVDFSWANTQIDPNTIVFRVLGPAGGSKLEVQVVSVSYPPNES